MSPKSFLLRIFNLHFNLTPPFHAIDPTNNQSWGNKYMFFITSLFNYLQSMHNLDDVYLFFTNKTKEPHAQTLD